MLPAYTIQCARQGLCTRGHSFARWCDGGGARRCSNVCRAAAAIFVGSVLATAAAESSPARCAGALEPPTFTYTAVTTPQLIIGLCFLVPFLLTCVHIVNRQMKRLKRGFQVIEQEPSIERDRDAV